MKLRNNIRVSHSEDGVLLLNGATGILLSSNVVGSQILKLLSEGRNVPGIADSLASVCGMPLETVRRDVDEFVDQLRQAGLLDEDR